MTAPEWTPKYRALCDDPDESHMKVVSLVPSGSHVLEVGPATGYMTSPLFAKGCSVVGVEADPHAAAVARARNSDVRVGLLEQVDLSDVAPFDCIVIADVLEHASDGDLFLSAALRFLRVGGSVVISVPNIAHWTLRWSLLNGRFDYTPTGLLDETHLKFYTSRSLESLLLRHDLKVIDRQGSLGLGVYHRWKSQNLYWYQRRALRILQRTSPDLFTYQFVWKAMYELQNTLDQSRNGNGGKSVNAKPTPRSMHA